MTNLDNVKVALFDFDDTLCIHKHIGVERHTDKEWAEAIIERNEDWYMDNALYTYSPYLKCLLNKLTEQGVQCYGLTWAEANGLYKARIKFVEHYYPGMLTDIFIVGSRENKVNFAKKICDIYGYSRNDILIVEDHPQTLAEFRQEGMQALGMSEICNCGEFTSFDEAVKIKQAIIEKESKAKQSGADKVTKEWCIKAKDMLEKGCSYNEIAKTFGVKYQDVANLKYRMKKQAAKETTIKVELKEEEPVKKESSVNDNTIQKMESSEKAVDMGKLKTLRNAGWSPARIAGDMHLDLEVVKEKLQELKR